MFTMMLLAPKALRLVNEILEDHVIPNRRLERNNRDEAKLHRVSLKIEDIELPMALSDDDIKELESSDGWAVIERGQKTFAAHARRT